MAGPTVRSVGAVATATAGNTLTPALPAGYQEDDTLVLIVCTEGSDSGNTVSTPSGWTELSTSPAVRTGVQLAVFYKISAASETAPTFGSFASKSQAGVMVCIQGTHSDGSPINTSVASADTADTNAGSYRLHTLPGVTTTSPETLVLTVLGINATGSLSNWTNSNITGLAEVAEGGTTTDYIGVAAGEFTSTGSTGNSTVRTTAGLVAMGVGVTIAFVQPYTVHTETPSDSASTADSATTSFGKAVTDTPSATEGLTFDTSKVLADSAGQTDSLTFDVDKELTDTSTATEAPINSVDRVSADTVSVDDVLIAWVDPNDTATATDDIAIEAGPLLTDSVTASDSISIGGAVTVEDEALATDTVVKSVEPAYADTISASDVPAVIPHDVATPTDVLTVVFQRTVEDNVGAGSTIAFETVVTSLRVTAKKALDPLARVTS